jgi:hypothetical protein
VDTARSFAQAIAYYTTHQIRGAKILIVELFHRSATTKSGAFVGGKAYNDRPGLDWSRAIE